MGFKGAQFPQILFRAQSQGFPPAHRWMAPPEFKAALWRFRSMQLNDGWCAIALKGALDGVIGAIRDNPDTLNVGMLLFQFHKDGSSEQLLDETGGVVDADHPDRLHSHRCDRTGLRAIGEPTDLQRDSRIGHSIEVLGWILSRIE